MSESNILDLNRPHTNLGPKDAEGYLWHGQDGWIFNWSDSNVQYEKAWWLDQNGIPVPAINAQEKAHIDNICRSFNITIQTLLLMSVKMSLLFWSLQKMKNGSLSTYRI